MIKKMKNLHNKKSSSKIILVRGIRGQKFNINYADLNYFG